jgi:3alpha(or 20beta)-hydroxysteroid dehydrogenase
MTSRLSGRVALVTGASRGMGECEARLFASEGATVVLADVMDELGATVAAGIGPSASYVHLDVTDSAAWASVVNNIVSVHGSLDVLVNNAGIFQFTPLLTATEDEYRRVIDINQVGVFLGMQAAARQMTTQRRGSIINISSVAGLKGSAGFIAYNASKFAVRGMTKSAAIELASTGVRVNSIHPGIINTQMAGLFDDLGVRDAVDSRIPLGREADPMEVANLALYLASDESSYSTGSEFVVDGGFTA